MFFEFKETTTPASIQKCAFTYSEKCTATATLQTFVNVLNFEYKNNSPLNNYNTFFKTIVLISLNE